MGAWFRNTIVTGIVCQYQKQGPGLSEENSKGSVALEWEREQRYLSVWNSKGPGMLA